MIRAAIIIATITIGIIAYPAVWCLLTRGKA